MTRKEFEKLRLSIEGEKYKPLAANPITIGLERAEFEKKRLERLIVAAGTCGAITVQKRLQVYKREIKRVETSLERFAKLREEARDSRPVVEKRLRSQIHAATPQ